MIAYLGIDPGLDGAVALIEGSRYTVLDTVTFAIKNSRGRTRRNYDAPANGRIVKQLCKGKDVRAVVEAVNSMPGQGVRSMFNMGVGVGMWVGLLAILEIPVIEVRPQTWRRELLRGVGSGKDASILMAKRLFPKADLSLKKHHGRAEGLLLAEYARKYYAATGRSRSSS